MADWTRRVYDSIGLTQIPAGPHLRVLQSRYGGTVMLMIDVSGSMHGAPILEAVRGARQFVAEAVRAYYQVGVMLWNTDVVAVCEPTADGVAAHRVLAPVDSAAGGTLILEPLRTCHRILDRYSGDRVVAIFGDGDLTPWPTVLAQVELMKSEDIRFVTRGLGSAANAYSEISDEDPATSRVDRIEDLAAGIASMSSSLRTAPRSGQG